MTTGRHARSLVIFYRRNSVLFDYDGHHFLPCQIALTFLAKISDRDANAASASGDPVGGKP